MSLAKNPILSGFYPDPSICAVGDDFYIVNSTFCYFPGLPVMHSKDLAHWEQIGNVLTRKSQLSVPGCELSAGLYAPTIRYHEGTFYVACTNVSQGGNFIVTASDPKGPWSDPYYLEGADGIDPSLFFDDDGRCYYIGTHENPEGAKYNGDWYIYIQELDIKEMKLVGEHKNVWNGAMKNIIWPEGPHIYKKDGYYYILHAEGGTGPDHAVSVCRSKDIWGPYENNFCNPILTHRHFGQSYPIRYVGHGDLVETENHEWYMVLLAVRQTNGFTTMGRETFLAKVTWENDWPVVNPGYGQLTDTVEIDLPDWKSVGMPVEASQREYDFSVMKELGPEFLFLRDEEGMRYELALSEGIRLFFSPFAMTEDQTQTYMSIRQQHKKFDISADINMPVSLAGGKKAGIAYVQNQQYFLAIELFETAEGNAELSEEGLSSKAGLVARAVLYKNAMPEILGEKLISDDDIALAEQTGNNTLTLTIHVDGIMADASLKYMGKEINLAKYIDISALSTEVAGGFVGCTCGVFTSWEGMPKEGADKEYVSVKKLTYEKHD